MSATSGSETQHGLYGRWMLDWESRLCQCATNRVVRPFDWGIEWTARWPCAVRSPRNGHDPETYVKLMNRAVIEGSDDFFAYRRPSDFAIEGNLLRFTSPVATPYAQNNVVHGQWFPARHKPGS